MTRRVFSNRFERFTEYRRQEHRGAQRWRFRVRFRFRWHRQAARSQLIVGPSRFAWWHWHLAKRYGVGE